MADMMTFPNTVDEFMEQYKIVDTERVYTNGTEMIPIFRMQQWFEHKPEQRTGKWIKVTNTLYKCDQCGAVQLKGCFCKDCGAKMTEGGVE